MKNFITIAILCASFSMQSGFSQENSLCLNSQENDVRISEFLEKATRPWNWSYILSTFKTDGRYLAATQPISLVHTPHQCIYIVEYINVRNIRDTFQAIIQTDTALNKTYLLSLTVDLNTETSASTSVLNTSMNNGKPLFEE